MVRLFILNPTSSVVSHPEKLCIRLTDQCLERSQRLEGCSWLASCPDRGCSVSFPTPSVYLLYMLSTIVTSQLSQVITVEPGLGALHEPYSQLSPLSGVAVPGRRICWPEPCPAHVAWRAGTATPLSSCP
jgi:hypothetical protein